MSAVGNSRRCARTRRSSLVVPVGVIVIVSNGVPPIGGQVAVAFVPVSMGHLMFPPILSQLVHIVAPLGAHFPQSITIAAHL
jgi:hypothetical protein